MRAVLPYWEAVPCHQRETHEGTIRGSEVRPAVSPGETSRRWGRRSKGRVKDPGGNGPGGKGEEPWGKGEEP